MSIWKTLAAFRLLALGSRISRRVPPLLTVAFAIAICAALVATIALTSERLQWLTFLGGVLFAGVVALVSQVSRMAWRLARREAQMQTYKDRLSALIAASDAARQTSRRVFDVVAEPVVQVDGRLRCVYHNAAAQRWFGVAGAGFQGSELSAVLGEAAYRSAEAHARRAEDLKPQPYLAVLPDATGRRTPFNTWQLSAPDVEPPGFYLVLAPADDFAAKRAARPAIPKAGGAAADPEHALYLETVAGKIVPGGEERRRLMQALRDNQFMLLAQRMACVDPSLPERECCEVLLRLKEEEQGMMPPGSFIPVAEHLGLMAEIDRWVVRSVVSHCAALVAAKRGVRLPLLSVNLSHAAIADPDFAVFVRGELQRPGFEARALCFEIDESEFIEHHACVRMFVAAVKPAGCRIAVDGFGRSRISFERLRGLRVDYLKFDGNLVSGVLRSPAELAKIAAVNEVCRKLNMRTVALFVESDEMAEALSAAGVDYLQGFGIARPVPLEDCLRGWASPAAA